MARLDVYAMPGGRPGYVLDVQAALLDHLRTRAVVPLVPQADAAPRIRDLNPVFDIDGTAHVMVTQAAATVPLSQLGRALLSLDRHHDEVTRALDILFIGF